MKQKLLLLLLFFGVLASAQNLERHNNGPSRISGSGLFKAIPPDPSASLANRTATPAAQPAACTTAQYGQYPSGVYIPTDTGSLETITASAYAGEFSVVAVAAGRSYVFSSSRADYITIATPTGTVLASGFTPLSWTNSNYNGNINYYLNTNSSCGTENVSRTRYITSSAGGCSTPFNFSATNVGPHSATFTWNPVGGNVQGYQLVFTELNGLSPDDTYPNGTITTTTNSSTSTGFTESTRYYVWVRTICSNGNSPWAALEFTTSPATGCTAGTYGQFPSNPYTPQCTGSPESITTSGYAGEYSGVNITANKRYTFTSSVTTDLLTITNANGVTIASGYTPLVWSSGTYNGTVRFYTHTGLSCGTAAVSRTRFVQCASVNCGSPSNFTFSDITSSSATVRWATGSPAPLGYQYELSYNSRLPYDDATEEGGILTSAGVIINDLPPSTTYYIFVRSVCDTQVGPWIAGGSFTTNPSLICNSASYGVYPDTAFTPSCTGANETIVTNAYAGELSYVNVTAGRQYVFSTSVATDFITITNAAGNIVYASGTGPVTWSSGNVSGNIRYFIHANGNCGNENVNRSRYIRCSSCNTVAPIATAQNFCGTTTVANLVASGINLKWYASATASTALTSNAAVSTGTYYVSQTVNNCESSRTSVTVIVNAVAVPTASDLQICGGGTVANLVATGTNIKWYNVDFGGSPLASTTPLVTGYYFATQTINGCESQRNVVYVTVSGSATVAPVVSAQSFCGSATVANLVASGVNIRWYRAATGGTAVTSNTALVSGVYYATQTVNGCESSRAGILVTVNNTVMPESSDVQICGSGTVANLVATGTNIKWYNVDFGGSPLAPTTPLVTGYYFPTQTINGCESARNVIYVTVSGSAVAAPTAVAQTFCGDKYIIDIVANGSNLKWYLDANGGSYLDPYTELTTRTYYVSQTVNGCESTRRAVAITANRTEYANTTNQTLCSGATVANLVATGTAIKWYNDDNGNPLPANTLLATGTYYVTQTVNGCESNKAQAYIIIGSSTNAPTAAATQNFCGSATVANLVANGTNIKWYTATTGGTALVATTALTARTYYASQTVSGCESPRTAVVVTLGSTIAPTASAQTFCGDNSLIDIVATGTNLKWYLAATGGSALDPFTDLTTRTYYVSQTVNGCESSRTAVAVTVNRTQYATVTNQTLCNGATVANLVATGTALKWYNDDNGNPLPSNTLLVTGTYFVTQTLNGCESNKAQAYVTITTTQIPNASDLLLCGSATVANLVATGTNIKWYNVFTGGTALAPTAAVTTGTYFVSQTVNGCESARNAVSITVNATALPTAAAQNFCGSATVANLVATGSNIKWYNTANGGSALAATTAITSSGTYYATQTVNNCESARVPVTVTVNAAPQTPVVTITQPNCASATGTIVVTAPTGTGLTYSINGTTYQASATFANVGPGTYSVTAKNAAGCISTINSAIVNPAPSAPARPTVTATQPTCAVSTGSMVVNTPTGTDLTFSINGTTYQTSNTFSNVAVGTYSVTAKNSAGCISWAASVTINAAPATPATPVVTTTQPTCSVATGTIVVTAPTGTGLTYSVNGTTYQASATFGNLAAGTYSVTAKNATGCTSAVTSVTINAAPATPTAPVVTITQPSCAVATGTIVVTSPTGTGLTYSVNGTAYQASATFTALAAGTYNVTAKNAAGCISAVTSVTINAAPATPSTPVVTTTQPTCAVATGTIAVTAPTGTGLTYSVNGTTYQASATFGSLAAGTYSVTAKNAAGCISVVTSVTINAAPATPTAPVVTITQPSCAVATGTIVVTSPTGTGLTFSVNGTIYQASATFTALAAGTYNVTAKNAAGCTSAVTSVTINAAPATPETPVVTTTQPTCSVATGTIVVTAPTGTGLTFSVDGTNYQTSSTFTALAAGTYNVTAKNAAGCISAVTSVTINAAPATPTAPVVTTTQPSCAVATGTIVVTSPTGSGLTFSVNGTTYQASSTFTALAAGTYNVTAKNAAGCTSAVTSVTINAAVEVPATPLVTVTQPDCTTSTGNIVVTAPLGTGLTYSINGTAYQASAIFATVVAGTYSVTVKNAAGCISAVTPVTINAAPQVPATPVVSVTQPTCAAPLGTVTVTAPTGFTYSIDGTNFQDSAVLSNVLPGTYQVTVKSAGGCTSTATVTVNAAPAGPLAPTAAAQIFCGSATVANLVATGTAVKWYANATGGTALAATATLATGTYYATQTVNGCESPRVNVNVTITPGTVPAFAAVAPICSGTTLAALPTTSTNGVTGTWSPALNNTATTTYTFTPATGQCATTATLTITVNAPTVPAFAAVAPICSGATLAALPTTSTNGVTGTWSPALNNTATTTYTFTPATGQCATTATLTITVNPIVVPAFAVVAPICSGATLAALPTTSTNGVTGTWSPALNNTATTTYTFTPATGQCAVTTTLTITVNPIVAPTFTAVAPICSGATLVALPTTSTNGVTGTWSPALNNTATTTYTFTPSAGQCAATATLTITVNAPTVPAFAVVAPICSGATLAALPTTSTNGVTGTWSPALNNTATTTYTFTPATGQCATTATLTITVNPIVVPAFAAVAPICSGATLAALPTTSTNGVTGTWSPALNNTATTTYTFTPATGQCAATTTLTITVNPVVVPAFAVVAPICSGTTLAALPTTSTNGVTGTWSPALNNTATTTYTFTPATGQCATTVTLTIEVTPATVPAFAVVAPICSGATLAALPTTSTNGVTGTWSPALNNTATTTYTFTPATGQCATTATLTITVNPVGTPTFAAVAPICSGATLAALPTTSTNGITGTWSPALNNTATTTYTFTPESNCADTVTLTIVVNPVVEPVFTTVDAICSGTVLAALPTTSVNGVTGTWSPELNNTATTTYTFTPDANQCAATATLTIEVTPATTPEFAVVDPVCSGATLEALPVTSTNGITGTWSPELNNTATTTYTFTPDANQCAATATLTIEVNTLDATTSLNAETITAIQQGATYQWVDCANGNAVIEGATDQSYTATANGQYAVMIEFNGCNAVSECVTISTLSIKNPIVKNNLVIYPSPATTVLNIKTDEVIKAVKIVDLFGKTISVTNFADNKIDVRILEAGVYFVEIQTTDNKYVQKFVKD
ncbi:fibronectin type III domain-containing protein [Flavobacterium psychrotrophum]|uniref:Ig-like domain-containing protein n=1 Tax=Flavobacterium psychrotrophum TaxID=2294119 RepID=UPI000E324E42|nr:fibronectin type III domain-containing protein [Flavobacterium psychrotrophum]